MLLRIESRMDGMQGAIKLLNQKFDSLMEQQYLILTEKEQELLDEEQLSAARSETSENKFFGEFAGGMRPNFPFSSGGIVRMQCEARPTFTRDKSESDTELDTFITDNSAMANTDRQMQPKRVSDTLTARTTNGPIGNSNTLPARTVNGLRAKTPPLTAAAPSSALPAAAPSPSPAGTPNAGVNDLEGAPERSGENFLCLLLPDPLQVLKSVTSQFPSSPRSSRTSSLSESLHQLVGRGGRSSTRSPQCLATGRGCMLGCKQSSTSAALLAAGSCSNRTSPLSTLLPLPGSAAATEELGMAAGSTSHRHPHG